MRYFNLLLTVFTLMMQNVVGQNITPEMFTWPANTGANMTVGVNASKLDQFEGGTIGAFIELEGVLTCVGLETISTGFFGLAVWGDDISTSEADGLASGATPTFAILHERFVIIVAEPPQFTGYVTNGNVYIQYVNLYYNGCNDPNYIEHYTSQGISDYYDYLYVEQTNLNCETRFTDADIDQKIL